MVLPDSYYFPIHKYLDGMNKAYVDFFKLEKKLTFAGGERACQAGGVDGAHHASDRHV